MKFAGLLVVIAGLAGPAGQSAPPPVNPFAGVRSLACTFPVYARADLAATPPQPISRQQEFTFTLDSFDFKKLRARIVGSGGATSPVSLLASQVGLTVIEQTLIGNVNMTTVFAAGSHDDTRLAVHSRHFGDPTELPSVSQAYGSCVVQK